MANRVRCIYPGCSGSVESVDLEDHIASHFRVKLFGCTCGMWFHTMGDLRMHTAKERERGSHDKVVDPRCEYIRTMIYRMSSDCMDVVTDGIQSVTERLGMCISANSISRKQAPSLSASVGTAKTKRPTLLPSPQEKSASVAVPPSPSTSSPVVRVPDSTSRSNGTSRFPPQAQGSGRQHSTPSPSITSSVESSTTTNSKSSSITRPPPSLSGNVSFAGRYTRFEDSDSESSDEEVTPPAPKRGKGSAPGLSTLENALNDVLFSSSESSALTRTPEEFICQPSITCKMCSLTVAGSFVSRRTHVADFHMKMLDRVTKTDFRKDLVLNMGRAFPGMPCDELVCVSKFCAARCKSMTTEGGRLNHVRMWHLPPDVFLPCPYGLQSKSTDSVNPECKLVKFRTTVEVGKHLLDEHGIKYMKNLGSTVHEQYLNRLRVFNSISGHLKGFYFPVPLPENQGKGEDAPNESSKTGVAVASVKSNRGRQSSNTSNRSSSTKSQGLNATTISDLTDMDVSGDDSCTEVEIVENPPRKIEVINLSDQSDNAGTGQASPKMPATSIAKECTQVLGDITTSNSVMEEASDCKVVKSEVLIVPSVSPAPPTQTTTSTSSHSFEAPAPRPPSRWDMRYPPNRNGNCGNQNQQGGTSTSTFSSSAWPNPSVGNGQSGNNAKSEDDRGHQSHSHQENGYENGSIWRPRSDIRDNLSSRYNWRSPNDGSNRTPGTFVSNRGRGYGSYRPSSSSTHNTPSRYDRRDVGRDSSRSSDRDHSRYGYHQSGRSRPYQSS